MATSPKSMKTTRTQSSIPPIIVKSTFVCRTKKRFKEHWEIFRTKENIKNSQIKMTIISTNYLSTWKAKMVREKTMTVVIPAAMITASVSYFMLTCFQKRWKNVELPPKKRTF